MSETIDARPVVMWAVYYREHFHPEGRWYVATFTIDRTRAGAVRRWETADPDRPRDLGAHEKKRKRGAVKAARVEIRPWPGHTTEVLP